MASKAVINAVEARIASNLAAYRYVDNDIYNVARAAPDDVDEWISARFPGSFVTREEIGVEGENMWSDDSSFRIDVYVRINPLLGTPNEIMKDRLIAIKLDVETAFRGRVFGGVEIFSMRDGLDVPEGTPKGWWAESISFQYHHETYGP